MPTIDRNAVFHLTEENVQMRNRFARAAAVLSAIAVVPVLAIPAQAAPVVHISNFSGGWTTECDLSYTPDGGARSGPYTCDHTATSTACLPLTTRDFAELCSARLVSGTTSGFATGSEPYSTQIWACWDGSGSGTFSYKPSRRRPTFTFPVTLTLNSPAGTVDITGSYYDPEDDGFITVRASIPAVCRPFTSATAGFEGYVSPF